MIEVVINFDDSKNMFKVYEQKSDTLIVTATLSDSLLKLNEFLLQQGMISGDIMTTKEVTYHLDSGTMAAMIKSNVNLLKRLSNAQSGFTSSSQKFNSSSGNNKFGSLNSKKWKSFGNSFKSSYKKFGSKG